MGGRSKVFEEIAKLAKQQHLIIDGAMGTMIQREHLEEKDFRNEVQRIPRNFKMTNFLLLLL